MERVIVLAVIVESIGVEAVILYVEVEEKENGSVCMWYTRESASCLLGLYVHTKEDVAFYQQSRTKI